MLPRLLFIRTRLPIDTLPDGKAPIDEAAEKRLGMQGTDVIVFPIPVVRGAEHAPHVQPDYVDYAEAVSILPDLSIDPFGSLVPGEDDPDSHHIAVALNSPYGTPPPSFGRKLLLVNFCDEPDDGTIERITKRIRRAIHCHRSVWHGRRFEAFCFIDPRPMPEVRASVDDLLSYDDVCDYLIVQPIEVVRKDRSGLSPLGDWLDRGWRNGRR